MEIVNSLHKVNLYFGKIWAKTIRLTQVYADNIAFILKNNTLFI